MRFFRKIRRVFTGSWLMARLLLSIEGSRLYWEIRFFPAGVQQIDFFRQHLPRLNWIYEAPFIYGLYFNSREKRITLRRISKVNMN